MYKLRFDAPSYKYYKNGVVTVCKYGCTILNNQTKGVVKQFVATGVAKCAPDDILDVDLGKRLADSRAKLNAYKEASHLISDDTYNKWSDEVDRKLDVLDFVDQMTFLKNKEIDHIKYVCDEV